MGGYEYEEICYALCEHISVRCKNLFFRSPGVCHNSVEYNPRCNPDCRQFIAYAITGVILPLAYIFLFIGGDISRGWFMTILSLVVIYCIAYGVSYAKHGTIIEFWRGPKFLKMW